MSTAIEVIATTISGSISDWKKVERIEPLFNEHGFDYLRLHVVDSHGEARGRARELLESGSRLLISAGGSVATFSGHGHQAQSIEFDRHTLAVRSVPFGPSHAPERTVTMLTAPALAQLPRNGARQPGYLLATFDDGQLASLKLRTVA